MKIAEKPRYSLAGTVLACTLFLAAIMNQVSAKPLSREFSVLDTYIASQLERAGIPGAALVVVSKEGILHARGFGRTGPDMRAVTPQTQFQLGSLSKSITALGIMQLVEAGKLTLDDPVQRHVPWFAVADAEASKKITVFHLLHQVSGFSYAEGDKDAADLNGPGSALERRVRQLRSVQLHSQPGARFEYSSVNYVILGYLIEIISGESYSQYVKQHVFTPLGMGRSAGSKQDNTVGDVATGHRYWFGRAVPATDLPYPQAYVPSGYLISSAEDMGRYLIAHLNGAAPSLTREGIDRLHHQPAGIASPYAMGWFVDESNPSMLDHSGAVPNFITSMAIDMNNGWGFAILVNAHNTNSGPDVLGLGSQIKKTLQGDVPLPIRQGSGMLTPNLMGLSALMFIQLVLAYWMIRRVRHWRTGKASLPGSNIGCLLLCGLPMLAGAALAVCLTIVIPMALNISFSGLLLNVPDASWLILVNTFLCLAMGIVFPCVAWRAYRNAKVRR